MASWLKPQDNLVLLLQSNQIKASNIHGVTGHTYTRTLRELEGEVGYLQSGMVLLRYQQMPDDTYRLYLTDLEDILEEELEVDILFEPRIFFCMSQDCMVVVTLQQLVIVSADGSVLAIQEMEVQMQDAKAEGQNLFVLNNRGEVFHYTLATDGIVCVQITKGVSSIEIFNGQLTYTTKDKLFVGNLLIAQMSSISSPECKLQKLKFLGISKQLLTIVTPSHLVAFEGKEAHSHSYDNLNNQGTLVGRMSLNSIIHVFNCQIMLPFGDIHLSPLFSLSRGTFEQEQVLMECLPHVFLQNGLLNPEVNSTLAQLRTIPREVGTQHCILKLLFEQYQRGFLRVTEYFHPKRQEDFNRFGYSIEKMARETLSISKYELLQHFASQLICIHDSLWTEDNTVRRGLNTTLQIIKTLIKVYPLRQDPSRVIPEIQRVREIITDSLESTSYLPPFRDYFPLFSQFLCTLSTAESTQQYYDLLTATHDVCFLDYTLGNTHPHLLPTSQKELWACVYSLKSNNRISRGVEMVAAALAQPSLSEQIIKYLIYLCVLRGQPLCALALVHSRRISWMDNLDLVFRVHSLCSKSHLLVNLISFKNQGIQRQRDIQTLLSKWVEYLGREGELGVLKGINIDQTTVNIIKPVLQKLIK